VCSTFLYDSRNCVWMSILMFVRNVQYNYFSLESYNLSIIESLRLEKTSKIIKPNCQPNTIKPAKPHPEVLYLHIV